jgi:hypothetical protein
MNPSVCWVASVHTLALTTNMALMLLNYTPLLTALGGISRYENNKQSPVLLQHREGHKSESTLVYIRCIK